ncbi:bifunctional YncE family protein/alkaline phosphatase family protein [Acidicapsa acidisoli]|uniref:bifunctional YncE family protein/alkaline phosphatase family protein n=1 Tax=Acidicapsa acidisoli TaxID=1615681 RepID=UPI0021DF5881|nr:beta-propeller fold lactonase family protein [Acidicapsa acidisoli]
MKSPIWIGFLPAILIACLASSVGAQDPIGAPQAVPSGQIVTPLAPAGARFSRLNPGLKDFPDYTAGQAVKTALSPDGNTLLILTSGYNRLNNAKGVREAADSNEYVFVFDLSHGALEQKQVFQVPNTFVGMAFSPDGNQFYVSGGVDDNIHAFSRSNGLWAESGPPMALGHAHGVGIRQKPTVANLAVTDDGKTLVAANIYNDSISIIDLASRGKVGELDLRPGIIDRSKSGVAGGESPFGVAIKGSRIAYVSSERDREIDVVDISKSASPKLLARIPVLGNPNNLVLNATQTRLFAAADNSDRISVIDTATNAVVETIHTTAPSGLLRRQEQLPGAASNSLVLSPDQKTLYVSNGGMNAIAVITLAPGQPHHVVGLIPTGWYPQSVSISRDGRMLYDVNSKSNPGPNPLYDGTPQPADGFRAHQIPNQYILQLEKAGLQALPVPDRAELARLTRQVAENNFLDTLPDEQDEHVMAALRQHIKHVIYIVKENRTYDQVLGDLDRGNGDPSLAEFGKVITPNQHRLAEQFVDLDNFYCSGEVSGNGWPWSTSAREMDINVKTVPLSYAGRGSPRGINVDMPTVAERQINNPNYPNDPNLLPGLNDDNAPDGPDGEKQQGYIWSSVLRHGLTLRNYGFEATIPPNTPEVPDPFTSHTIVDVPTRPQLVGRTDPYFRAFDNAYPDFRRELEWEREFDQYVAHGDLPSLELVRFMHDHEGNFDTAIDDINTPERETADNDYAVGKLIERIAHSPYKDSTLIFIIEDDAQAGPDHVDAHRSIGFVAGPYVKQSGVVHERYSTVNMIRTMEDVLGIGHLNLNDAYQRPMTAAFDLNQSDWTYSAITPAPISQSLGTQRQQSDLGTEFHDAHSAAYWASLTRGFDWSTEDRVPPVLFNRILWKGLTDGQAYPLERNGQDYSRNRATVLKDRSIRFRYEGQ